MALNLQIAENGYDLDMPVANYSGTDIPANFLVQIDTTYYNSASQTIDGLGVILPSGGGVRCVGVTLEIIKAGAAAGTPGTAGRVRFFGPLAVCIATAAINVNAQVMADNTTPGNVKTYASAAVVLGIALTQAGAAGDQILVMLSAGQVAV
jgi:hypothetical protein